MIFWFFRGLKGQKINQNDKSFCLSHLIFQNHIKGQKMMENCLFQYVMLCISGTVDHIIEILLTISAGVFCCFFLQKYNIVNIKIILFFIGPLQQFFYNYLFLKFINKWKKKIWGCAPPSSHVCDFFTFFQNFDFSSC